MANFDIASFNLINWANATPDLYDSVPKNVEIVQKDANGNLFTKTIANRGMFKQQLWDDVGGALGQFNRTFYVDAVNGDDNNTGASDAPFKTIKKAVDSVPVSGMGKIYFLNDYDFTDGKIPVLQKNITLFINKYVINVPVNSSGTYQALEGGFQLFANGVINLIFTTTGQLNIGNTGYDSNKNWGGNGKSFINYSHEALYYSKGRGQINILANQSSVNYIILTQGQLIGPNGGSTAYSGSGFDLSVVQWNCSGSVFVLNSGNSLQNVVDFLPPINFLWYTGFQDESGNTLNITDKVSGVVKDANGVPRNIISNIVF